MKSDKLPSDSPVTIELLTLCEEFFRTASSTVHTELRQFLTSRGHHPIASHGWFLDALAFITYRNASEVDAD